MGRLSQVCWFAALILGMSAVAVWWLLIGAVAFGGVAAVLCWLDRDHGTEGGRYGL